MKQLIFKMLMFLKPMILRARVQPTIKHKPFGKPFKYIVIKIGFNFYILSYKPKVKLEYMGSIAIDKDKKE